MELIFGLDVRPILPALKVPTLIVHRAGNVLYRVGHGRYLRDHIPGAKYVELPGADHWPLGEVLLHEVEGFVTGARPAQSSERVLATVVFTDIVGSTERAAAMGDDRWRDLLDRHDGTCRRVIERFRGRYVESTGDGLLATFDGPARSVESAQVLQQAVADLGLHIRVGIHTGEIELRGDCIAGISVHATARILAKADADQILVSRTVKDLVVGSGICFEHAGTHALKGIPGDWDLFRVSNTSSV